MLAYSTARRRERHRGATSSRTLETFGDQEEAHASALRSAIDELGFDPPDQPDSPSDTAVFDDVEGLDADAADELSDLLSELDGLKGRDRLLEYLAKVERRSSTTTSARARRSTARTSRPPAPRSPAARPSTWSSCASSSATRRRRR